MNTTERKDRILWIVSFTILTLFTGCQKNPILPTDVSVLNIVKVDEKSSEFVNASDFGAKGLDTDDTQALQAAIDTRKIVHISSGTYIISKPLKKNGGTLIIKGDNAIIKLSKDFPKSTSYTGAFVLTNITKTHIEGITIDGDRTNLTYAGQDWRNFIMGFYFNNCSNVLMNNCAVNNSPSMSYSFHSCSNVKVIDCSSTNGMFHGLELYICTTATILQFKYIGIGNQGTNPAVGGIGILATLSNYINIVKCYIEDSPDTGTKTEGCNYVTWDGNTVKNSGKDGIKFQNLIDGGKPVTTVYHGSIINNTVDKIYNGRSDGSSLIQVWNAQDVAVSNNKITGGIKTGYEAGIEVWASNGVTKNVTISYNQILNTNRFIYLSNASEIDVIGNICENVVDPISTGGNGFQAEESRKFIVKNNQFKRHDTTAINGSGAYMYNCGDFVFSYNTITNANNGICASFTNSQTINISNNNWSNFGRFFGSLGVNSVQAIDSLLMNNNTISKIGTGPLLFKITLEHLALNVLNLKNTKVIGNGTNHRWAIEISAGGRINKTDLTNFSTNGNAIYPSTTVLRGCVKIIGWKSTAPPKSGTWSVGDVVYNISSPTPTAGWLCIVAGTPGVWKSIP